MKRSLTANESGMAIITALLVLMLASGLMAGMFAALLANQRSHATDRDQSVAYAAAHAGLEKLTASLASLFVTDFSPSATQISVIDNTPPTIAGFEYTAPGGAVGSGYQITFNPDPNPGPNQGNPLAAASADITAGPFEGFKGLVTPYTITVTARSTTGNSEVRLRRELQTVAVPVFQFGVFGEKSLGFHAGPNFDFGGRVHTNQSLYVASGGANAAASTLTFRDKITAFTQVVRNTLMNGVSIVLTNHQGTVSLPTVIGGAAGTYRALQPTEGSGTTATPWNGWKGLSEDTYHANIRTETTGARLLNLPLASQGATPIDLIRRPIVANEDTSNAAVFGQRYFAQASLRILLSDRSTDITSLPTIVTATAPVDLANLAASGYVVAAGKPPVALSPGPEPFLAANGTSLTRVSAIAGSTLTIQTSADGITWNNGVAGWLKWTGLTVGGVGVSCTGLTSALLSGCGNHPAAAVNTPIIFTLANGTTVATTVSATTAAAVNSATISLLDTFTTAQRFVATRSFFVGEDPVTCAEFTASTLLNCTWPGGTALAANDPVYTGATTTAATPLLHGFLKIEKQNSAGVWSDVTMELLNLGFASPNQQGLACADPTPDAVIRLQRLRDNGMTTAGACAVGQPGSYTGSLAPTDFWPNTIFDAREGSSRLLGTNLGMNVGGVLSYVAIDVGNLARWFAGTIPAAGSTGNLALNTNGYIVYFSDRRGDHNENLANDPETGEYGFEDSINPAAAAWAKNNALDVGEDFNENNTLETYGETPHALVGFGNAIATMRFDNASRPWDSIPLLYSGRGRLARPVLFRRALKLTNGGMVANVSNNLPNAGFTVTAENPVYVQGNYNATAAQPNGVIAEPNVASAIIADSITLLSNAFNDAITFQYPNDENNRNATSTGYRFAMATGKTVPFPKPGAWGVQELGSDGGVHNFMKMLEDWGGQNLRYRGSMVSLYYSRQAIGIYRADANVYGAPTRGYNFDTDFLVPALLPPGTPMFRDINTLKFRQILRPNQ